MEPRSAGEGPGRSAPQRVLIGIVKAYRLLLSPWLGSNCRFHPTCSAYALQALDSHGAAAGSYLTLRRLARCHPACPGGSDPVPPLGIRARPVPNEKMFP